jgi:soluble lytic murein transglycosylase-like protein
LPAAFLIHVLFQESHFEPGIISSAGAEGIAQFMPETSARVGLANPFDPAQAIPAAARLLYDLAREFGSLGLAVAAQNAGAARIVSWFENKSSCRRRRRSMSSLSPARLRKHGSSPPMAAR